MPRLPRANKELYEPIEKLQARYVEAGKDVVRAFGLLEPDDIAFISREAHRILIDPLYYLQNYHFIRTKQLNLTTIYPLFDSQAMLLEVFMNDFREGKPCRYIVLKSRQQGITSAGVSLMFWLSAFHPMCHTLNMSDEDDKLKTNYDMCRVAYAALEWWLKPEKRYDNRPQLLGFDRTRQEAREDSSGMEANMYFESANQPSGAGYSKSIYGAHLAEIGRYRNPDPITEGVFGSLVEYEHSIGIMEGTAHGRGTTFHKLWEMAERGEFWTPIFMEWFREPGYSVTVPEGFSLTYEEKAIVKKVKEDCQYDLSNGQMAWRRKKKAEFEATGEPEKFEQEFPLTPVEAFISSGLTAFPKKRLHEMEISFGRKPPWKGEIRLDKNNLTPVLIQYEEGRFELWEKPIKDCKYQIGADCAMGIEGGDYSCAEVFAVPDNISMPIRQVARWRGYMTPTEFARVLAAIGYLFNTAELAPEVNKITTVVSDVGTWLNYPNIYRAIAREDRIGTPLSNYLGWQTNVRNRNELIGRFRDALLGWTVIIRSTDDIDEMYDFVETDPGTGRFEAAPGEHDDTVFACMIGYYTAVQLRPRWTPEPEPEQAVKGDYFNTDASPYWDKIEGINRDPTQKAGGPDFMEL